MDQATIIDTLMASAKCLRRSGDNELNADRLETLAKALSHPSGFALRVLGAIRYERLYSTEAEAAASAKANGIDPNDYEVAPVFVMAARQK